MRNIKGPSWSRGFSARAEICRVPYPDEQSLRGLLCACGDSPSCHLLYLTSRWLLRACGDLTMLKLDGKMIDKEHEVFAHAMGAMDLRLQKLWGPAFRGFKCETEFCGWPFDGKGTMSEAIAHVRETQHEVMFELVDTCTLAPTDPQSHIRVVEGHLGQNGPHP